MNGIGYNHEYEAIWWLVAKHLCNDRFIIRDREPQHLLLWCARAVVKMTHKDSLLHYQAVNLSLILADGWRSPHSLRAHLGTVSKRWRRQNPQG